jgi:hypothetical protein
MRVKILNGKFNHQSQIEVKCGEVTTSFAAHEIQKVKLSLNKLRRTGVFRITNASLEGTDCKSVPVGGTIE